MSPIDRVVDLILPRRNALLAEQIAQNLRETVVAQADEESFAMSAHQLRGYIRARSGGLVAAKVELATRKHRPNAPAQARLLSTATERLIALVAADLLDRQPSAKRLRAAA
ncbi:MAG: hypothetical protein HQ567_03235 [Candidatus Nealsonbacteria bacterium]|nr:hypothetical protein [Candidatus Nealsonbacteria bacterium]